MKYTPEQLQGFVAAIEEADVELSKWEEDFVANIRERLERRWELSDRQVEILDRLYAEKTP